MNIQSTSPKPLTATTENKQKFEAWLVGAQPLWGGTDPRESLKVAFKINPDSIFLLSDGEFQGQANDKIEGVIPLIREKNVNNISINTIAFEDRRSEANLIEVAEITGGENRFVSLDSYHEQSLNWSAQSTVFSLKELAKLGRSSLRAGRKRSFKYAIPMLQHKDPLVRTAAQGYLHTVSLNLYRDQIPSVDSAKTNEDLEQIESEWKQMWDRVGEIDFLNSGPVLLREHELEDVLMATFGRAPDSEKLAPLRRMVTNSNLDASYALSAEDRLLILDTAVTSFRGLDSPLNVQYLTSMDVMWITGLTGTPHRLEGWAYRHQLATQQLIPLLEMGDPANRNLVEKALRNLSFHLFEAKIRPIDSTENETEFNEVILAWEDLWYEANQTAVRILIAKKTGATFIHHGQEFALSPNAITPSFVDAGLTGSILHHRLLAVLGTSDSKDSFLMLQELCDDEALDIKQKELIGRALVDFQYHNGVSKESHAALAIILKRLSPSTRARKFRPGRYATTSYWNNMIEKGIAKRKSESKRLYRILGRLSAGSNHYERIKTKLLDLYPESRHARAIRKDVDVDDLPEGDEN